ncbi:MAG TPA: M20/M25/M40 family metallo-hydrolase [Thermoanaerobaculia bacterium]|nr:M20/M25/M40 family metallo-hydrolase [Thermoanaerobaculia bacterium]
MISRGSSSGFLGVPRGVAAVAIIFLVAASLQCRKAEGVAENPIDTEAEETFVEYLRIDTTVPPGNETAGATYLRDLLVKNGITATLVGDDPARRGVYARLDSQSAQPALLLLSHIDVVPAEAAHWRNPPFGGKREGGYIWGRGAIDNKSMTIAHVMSLLDLKRRGAKLSRDVVFLAVPDEERGGLRGAKALLERQPRLFDRVGFVLNEGGTNETVIDRVTFWGIEVQQKVPLWLRVNTVSAGGHAAGLHEQRGATMKLVRALTAIDALETPYRLVDDVARVAAVAAPLRRNRRAAGLRLLREPLDTRRVEREASIDEKALLRDTITVTQLSARASVNVMPSRAFGEVDIRLLPGSRPEQMLARVREAVGNEATVEVILAGEPVPSSSIETELYATLARVLRSAAPGSSVAPSIGLGTTDSRFFRARGITAYGIAPFKLNAYDAEGVHGDNERIRARFFSEGVALMRTIVREFCEQK